MWIDDTSYEPGQKGTIEPKIWRLDECEFKVFIHRWKGERGWYTTAKRLGVDTFDLRSGDDLQAAKTNAIACVRERLASMTSSFACAASKAV